LSFFGLLNLFRRSLPVRKGQGDIRRLDAFLSLRTFSFIDTFCFQVPFSLYDIMALFSSSLHPLLVVLLHLLRLQATAC